jgi:outer membrane lipoprotein SlyB
VDMARPPRKASRGSAGGAGRGGSSSSPNSSGRGAVLATRGSDAVDRRPGTIDGEDMNRCSDDDLEIEDDDDIR